jgi:muramoyltetrapeptide carboxypeptidase LdcA involved in peptidoglycan recycling
VPGVTTYPVKPRPGDRVAILSPSFGAPAAFPAVYDLGLRRLRDEFGLVPMEYPTTRAASASAHDRARDFTAAFADPTVTAVLATIGGHDLITVTPHIDPAAVAANPKPFFGFSDNTNLLNYLYGLGMVAYHGGSVLVHLGRPGGLHPVTADSLRAALFTSDWYELKSSPDYSDEPGDWNDPATLDRTPTMFPGTGWDWHGPATVVEGPTWGGNLEVLHWLLAAGRVGPSVDYAGCVLVIETSEELPSDVEVYRILRNMGERGLLAGFPAVLVGRPKAWHFDRRLGTDEKRAYAAAQRAAVTRALAEYNPDAVAVFDLDIGHTDPQQILPYGGTVRVDAVDRRIAVRY